MNIQRKTRTASIAITALAIAAIAASLLPVRAWPLEILASFRVQLILVSAVAASAAIALRLRFFAVAGVALVVFQMAGVFPMIATAARTDLSADQVNQSSYKVLTLNLEWTNRADEEVLDAIRALDPDILCVEEVNLWWRKKLSTLDDLLPYQAFDPLSKRPGVAVLSKIEIADQQWRPLHGRPYAILEMDDGKRRFHLATIHTLPPRSPLLYRARNRQMDELADYLRGTITDAYLPLLVAGDFNTTPWSPVMIDFQAATGLTNIRSGRGTYPTWPSWNRLLQVPIDHIFHSPHFQVGQIERFPVAESDHIGLWAELTLGPESG